MASSSDAGRQRPWVRAFTLVELLVVVAMMGLLAAVSIPAVGGLEVARRESASAEVMRMLIIARGNAQASGNPMGMYADPTDDVVAMAEMLPGAAAPTYAADVMGISEGPISLAEVYSGAGIAAVTHGDGSAGAGILWFSPFGEPHLRDADGVYLGDWTQDAEIEFDGARTVTVGMATGRVTR